MSKIRRVQEILMAGVLVLLTSSLTAAEGKPTPPNSPKANWIRIEGTQPFVMLADTDQVAMPLLVTLDEGVPAGEVKLKLLGVRYDKLVDQRVADPFTVKEKIEENGARGPTLTILVDLTKGLRPGNYELIIEANATGKPPLRLPPVNLEKPAVGFAQPAKLTIVQQYPFLPGETLLYPKQLLVDQTSESKFARAKGIVFYQPGYKQGDGNPSPGKIDPIITKDILPPGEPLVANLKLSDFPIGISTGSIQIRGADLKEPKSVEIEVRTRRSPDWIWLLIGGGLLFGWFLRSFLQERVELGQAKLEAQKVLETLPSRPDQAFKDDIKSAKEALQSALDQNQREEIVTRTKEFQEALKLAMEHWEERFKATEQTLQDLSKTVSRLYQLPPGIAAILEEARRSLEGARDSLKVHDVEMANTARDNLTDKLVRQMSQGILLWQGSAGNMLDSLAKLEFALDENLSGELVTSIGKLKEITEPVKIPTAMEEVPAAFEAVHDLQVSLRKLLAWLSRQVVEAAQKYGALLKTKGLNDPPGIADLDKKAAALRQELESATNTLDPAKPLYADKARDELRTSYRDLLRQTLSSSVQANLTEEQKQTIFAATAEGHYFEAAGVLLMPAKPTILGAQAPAGGPPPPSPTPLELRGAPPAAGAAVTQLVPGVGAPEPVEVMRARTLGELFWAKAAQTAIVGGAIAVVGYLLFAETFIGTPKELAAVFFWGFGLDVSMDNLLGQVAKLPGPRK